MKRETKDSTKRALEAFWGILRAGELEDLKGMTEWQAELLSRGALEIHESGTDRDMRAWVRRFTIGHRIVDPGEIAKLATPAEEQGVFELTANGRIFTIAFDDDEGLPCSWSWVVYSEQTCLCFNTLNELLLILKWINQGAL